MKTPTGRLVLKLVLIDEGSGAILQSARKELNEIYAVDAVDASEEILKFFTDKVVREVPAMLRALFEGAGIIPVKEKEG